MSGLGVGCRVYMGWTPDEYVRSNAQDIRCQTGIIIEGPFLPGVYKVPADGSRVVFPERAWNVRADDGRGACVPERLLTPVDDAGRDLVVDREVEHHA